MDVLLIHSINCISWRTLASRVYPTIPGKNLEYDGISYDGIGIQLVRQGIRDSRSHGCK